METAPLIVRHRPHTFAEVCGHKPIIDALQRRLAEPGAPHCYLFIGPSGVGKTTLARIVGHEFDAKIVEIDAATNSSVNDMRSLIDDCNYKASGANNQMLIIDECHRLSKPAWDAALKTLEEPHSYLYFGLATTELRLVPDTIISRSYQVNLEKLPAGEIEDVLCAVIAAENWDDTIDNAVFDLIVNQAEGSPRQALSLLQACYDAPDVDVARKIIAAHSVTEPMQQILQLLLRGEGSWEHIRPLLAKITEEGFTEQNLIHACRYTIGAIKREISDQKAHRYWELLAYMTYPARSFDPYSIFVSAVGRMLWSRE